MPHIWCGVRLSTLLVEWVHDLRTIWGLSPQVSLPLKHTRTVRRRDHDPSKVLFFLNYHPYVRHKRHSLTLAELRVALWAFSISSNTAAALLFLWVHERPKRWRLFTNRPADDAPRISPIDENILLMCYLFHVMPVCYLPIQYRYM